MKFRPEFFTAHFDINKKYLKPFLECWCGEFGKCSADEMNDCYGYQIEFVQDQ